MLKHPPFSLAPLPYMGYLGEIYGILDFIMAVYDKFYLKYNQNFLFKELLEIGFS